MQLSISEIAEATDGSLRPKHVDASARVSGITWDSRAVAPGCLYVALPGERVDGHDYIDAAVEAGAAAALVSRAVASCGAPQVVVDDTQAALAKLAGYWRRRLRGKVIGLTGSTGKTTTKNLVRDVLSFRRSVVATIANQNNELGVPNTLLAAEEDTDAVIVEMGMRGKGQIAELCAFATPDWGLVTNVGESHIELLGSRENIAHAKAELFEALPKGGIAFVNADDDYACELVQHARLLERGVVPVFFAREAACAPYVQLGVSQSVLPVVRASDVRLDGQGRPTFTMVCENFGALGLPDADAQHACTLELLGLHNVSNACAAAAVGLASGMTLAECCEALALAKPERGRQRVVRTAAGLTVVDDAYNANPDSMAASLATFAALDVPGKHVAVLGDMGELGDFAQECHVRVGTFAAKADPDWLLCVGELARFIAQGARDSGFDPARVKQLSSVDEALAELGELVGPDDAVLVKASHFMEFERIVEGLVG